MIPDLKQTALFSIGMLLLASFSPPPSKFGGDRPTTDTQVQGNCTILGFNHQLGQTNVDAIGFAKPLPPVISPLPGSATIPITGNVRPSGSSAYDPLSENLVYVNLEQELLYYDNSSNTLSSSTLLPPPGRLATAPAFLNGKLYLFQSTYFPSGATVQFAMTQIDLLTITPGATIVPAVLQTFTFGPLNSFFDPESMTSATNGTDEAYVLSGTNLVIISGVTSSPSACWIDLEPNFSPGNFVRFLCLEYKSPGILLAIKATDSTIELIEITINAGQCTASTAVIYDLSNVTLSPNGWIVNPEFYSTTYDPCDETYYISTLIDFTPPSSRLIEVDLATNSHGEHVLLDYLFGIEKNKDCCSNCCSDYNAFFNLINQGWQINIDPLNCQVTVSAPQFGPCHWLYTNEPDWGDGTPVIPGLTPATGSWTHTYTQSGTYVISALIIEGDGTYLCWELPMRIVFTIDCCPNSAMFVVRDTAFCHNTALSVEIPLENCALAGPCNTAQINWYVKPCSSPSWPLAPYQSSAGPGCSNLVLYPDQYPGETCLEVYAEVFLAGNCCGTATLLSNTATVTLCHPPGCFIINPNPVAPCQMIVPQPLQVSFVTTPACSYSVQWYYQGQPIPGATGLTYQPPVLSFEGSPNDCYYDHIFTAELSGICGPLSCSTRIRVYNENAPVGAIVMNPAEAMPFCPGEDATLHYQEACVGIPPMWEWYFSTAVAPVIPNDYVPLPGSGDMNPLVNTNKLFQTTWFAVKKQNGGCPAAWIEFQIEVKDALSITGFSAMPDPCVDTQVSLLVDFTPSPVGGSCMYIIDWYKDGFLIGTSTSNTAPVSFTYSNPAPGLGSLAGNYYATIRDNCCPQVAKTWVESIAPACVPAIVGPCFRCFDDPSPIVLTGIMLIPPSQPCPTACHYQWYEVVQGALQPIAGANQPTYTPSQGGTFVFEANCGGCVRQAAHTVVDCGSCLVSTDDLPTAVRVMLYPNPTSGELILQYSPAPLRDGRVNIVDVNGRVLLTEKVQPGIDNHRMSLAQIPAGIYLVQVFEHDVLVWIGKIVRQ
jgi:hypothetical protein